MEKETVTITRKTYDSLIKEIADLKKGYVYVKNIQFNYRSEVYMVPENALSKFKCSEKLQIEELKFKVSKEAEEKVYKTFKNMKKRDLLNWWKNENGR